MASRLTAKCDRPSSSGILTTIAAAALPIGVIIASLNPLSSLSSSFNPIDDCDSIDVVEPQLDDTPCLALEESEVVRARRGSSPPPAIPHLIRVLPTLHEGRYSPYPVRPHLSPQTSLPSTSNTPPRYHTSVQQTPSRGDPVPSSQKVILNVPTFPVAQHSQTSPPNPSLQQGALPILQPRRVFWQRRSPTPDVAVLQPRCLSSERSAPLSDITDVRKDVHTSLSSSPEASPRSSTRRSPTPGPSTSLSLYTTSHSQDSGQKKYQCPDCPKSYDKKNSLRKHRDIHKGKIHQCPECPKSYNLRASLTNHLKVHKRPEQSTCPFCQRTVSLPDSIRRHMYRCPHRPGSAQRLLPSGPYQCPECPKSFTLQSTLHNHRLTHSNKEHPCLLCPASFKGWTYLYHHRKREHAEQSTCPFCHKVATGSLARHVSHCPYRPRGPEK